MTFTYDLASSDAHTLAISKVRLELGDSTANVGMKPDGTNFSDEELSIWLDEESDHVMHTVIRACDTLARMWANVPNESSASVSIDRGKVSAEWAARAKELRAAFGETKSGSGGAFGVPSARVDGYSLNASATDL